MSTTKIGENRTIVLNCYFQAKSTPSPIKLNTYMPEIKFTWHKQYLFGLLFSIKVKEGSYRLKYTSIFLICPNLNDSQPFKSSSWKDFFIATCFDECFLFYVITGRRYFFKKVCRYCEIFSTVILPSFFKKSVLKEVRILYYLHKNSTNANPKSQITILIHTSKTFVADFFVITFFTLFIFWLFHTFLYKWNFSEKLKTSLKACF